MELIERYCIDHGIEYDPKLSPCKNMAKDDKEKHHNCPMAVELNGKITPMCNYQMQWIGNIDDTVSITIDDLMLIQKVNYLSKNVLMNYYTQGDIDGGVACTMHLREGITLVLRLLGFDLSEDSRIEKCEDTKEEVIKECEEQCKRLEDILRSKDCCATCKNYIDGKCKVARVKGNDLSWCSSFDRK
jgi:hypothetical protein